MKIVFFDVETTGVDIENSAIIQIGAILDIDGEEVDNIDIKIRPHDGASVSQEALNVTGITMEDLLENPERISPKEAYRKFLNFCGFPPQVYANNRILASGYNAMGFDMPMFINLGRRAGDQYSYAKFHWPVIDVAAIAAGHLAKSRHTMKNFKLMTVAERLGISTDGQAHDALFDVRVTRGIYYEIISSQYGG
jgi:DNA polymerase-3 subunit epsilon